MIIIGTATNLYEISHSEFHSSLSFSETKLRRGLNVSNTNVILYYVATLSYCGIEILSEFSLNIDIHLLNDQDDNSRIANRPLGSPMGKPSDKPKHPQR